MFGAIARRLFGSANDRFIKGLRSRVAAVNALEGDLETLDDTALAARTSWFRERLAAGETLDDLLVEAFATVREAAKRVLGQRHYDVQLVGGMVLHRGIIAEMKTGEGKTLVATLPVYLNALTGLGVHVVTVNDYLAQRDAEWMGEIYRFLGLKVGCIVHGLDDNLRREQYAADVTYATNNELGFDYLRDNMKFHLEEMVQRPFQYAIVDEVDSILIDEARTPLIISGPAEDSSELYIRINRLIPSLIEEDYEVDEKARSVTFTDAGVERMEDLLRDDGLLAHGGLYDSTNVTVLHHSNQALRAHKLFRRDTDYIVRNGQVVIIDEFTGRMMQGRRYSEGLHQALEAKEHVTVQPENQTLASITFQNYFRLYPKLAGMTGTAMTEAGEFAEIYKLEVIEIPTNVPCVRKDQDDEVYRTAKEKYSAMIDEIAECQRRGQPVLVGTVSIEKSEYVSQLLTQRKLPHKVLNARYHEQEALIVAQAGAPGAVTIATNMAGRGTDIQLGGNADMRIRHELEDPADEAGRAGIRAEVAANRTKVLEAGGLMIIGTERHESRRIDNQLRGRAGRQGDPGASKFYLSLEDDLMRIFGSDRIDGMLQRLGLKEGEAIIHPWVNRALEKAQQKVEARNFEIRKNLLKYDDVMNDQRKVIYEQRRELMTTGDVAATVADMRHQVIDDLVTRCIPAQAYAEQWKTADLAADVERIFRVPVPVEEWAKEEGIADQEIRERITTAVEARMAEREAAFGPEVMRMIERALLLQILDQVWKEHLLTLDHLRQGIGLRAYGQRDPLNEYKKEAFDLFHNLLDRLRERVSQVLASVEFTVAGADQGAAEARPEEEPVVMSHPAAPLFSDALAAPPTAPASALDTETLTRTVDRNDPASWGKVQRNAPCPCGSGRKYKHCHGGFGGSAQ